MNEIDISDVSRLRSLDGRKVLSVYRHANGNLSALFSEDEFPIALYENGRAYREPLRLSGSDLILLPPPDPFEEALARDFWMDVFGNLSREKYALPGKDAIKVKLTRVEERR